MFRAAAAAVLVFLSVSTAAGAAEDAEYRCSFENLSDLYIKISEQDRARVGLAPGIGNQGYVISSDSAFAVIENDRAGLPITLTTILRPSLRAVHSRHVVDQGNVLPSQGEGSCELISRTRPTAEAGQTPSQ